MSDINLPGEQPEDRPREQTAGSDEQEASTEVGPTRPQALTPGAARRRFAVEIKLLRERVGLTSAEAGAAIERSAATISRIDTGKLIPRNVDLVALLAHYRSTNPEVASLEVIERLTGLWAEGRKAQWFDPFKDLGTGAMVPGHVVRYMEYETDAVEVRTYESDVLPGLLQTREYARAIAAAFFPTHTTEDHEQFAEFRRTRQSARNERPQPFRLSVVVNEVALRRVIGGPAVHCAQLEVLADAIRDDGPLTQVAVVRSTAAIPAAMGGPFVIMSFGEDSPEADLVYLETRSGGNYLSDEAALERYYNYFSNLLDLALSRSDAVDLLRSIIRETRD